MGRRLFRTSRRDLALMAGLGAILIVYQWLYLAAIDRLGVTAATLVALCVPPVVVALVSTVFLAEPFTATLGAALIGAVVGTILLVAQPTGTGGQSPPPRATIIGILFALGSAGGVALHMLSSRLIASRQHALRPLAIGFPAGAIAFTPVALAHGVSLTQPAAGWFWLVYLGVVPSAIAYWMYQRGLRRRHGDDGQHRHPAGAARGRHPRLDPLRRAAGLARSPRRRPPRRRDRAPLSRPAPPSPPRRRSRRAVGSRRRRIATAGFSDAAAPPAR
jgi:hypothetical protein